MLLIQHQVDVFQVKLHVNVKIHCNTVKAKVGGRGGRDTALSTCSYADRSDHSEKVVFRVRCLTFVVSGP